MRPTMSSWVWSTGARIQDRLAVAQHCDGVADREDLLQFVADEDDTGAAGGQSPDHFE